MRFLRPSLSNDAFESAYYLLSSEVKLLKTTIGLLVLSSSCSGCSFSFDSFLHCPDLADWPFIAGFRFLFLFEVVDDISSLCWLLYLSISFRFDSKPAEDQLLESLLVPKNERAES